MREICTRKGAGKSFDLIRLKARSGSFQRYLSGFWQLWNSVGEKRRENCPRVAATQIEEFPRSNASSDWFALALSPRSCPAVLHFRVTSYVTLRRLRVSKLGTAACKGLLSALPTHTNGYDGLMTCLTIHIVDTDQNILTLDQILKKGKFSLCINKEYQT